MTDVQVQDYSVAFDGPHTIAKLAIVMIPGTFTRPEDREVDASHVHPAIRDHLARWAGISPHAVGILEALAVDEGMPRVGRERIQRALGLLR